MAFSLILTLLCVLLTAHYSFASTHFNTDDLTTLQHEVQDTALFCAFWSNTNRQQSPFPNLSPGQVTDACKYVSTDGISAENAGYKLRVACGAPNEFISTLQSSVRDPAAFCQFWTKFPSKSYSPFSQLSASDVSRICRCAAKSPTLRQQPLDKRGNNNAARSSTRPRHTHTHRTRVKSTAIPTPRPPKKIPAPPPQILAPVIPPGIDRAKISNLSPAEQQSLMFLSASNGSSDSATVASATVSLFYPSVNLDYSAYVTSVSCGKKSLTVRFRDLDGLSYARSNWASLPLVLITSSPTCGDALANTHFLVSSASYDDGNFVLTARGGLPLLKDLVKDLDLDFGMITINDTASSPSGNTTASPQRRWDKNLGFGINFRVDTVQQHGNVPMVNGPWGLQPQIFNVKPSAKDWAIIFATLQALQIFTLQIGGPPQGIRGYCVNCLASANMWATGSVSTSWGKITKAQATITGNINANVQLGIDAYVDVNIGTGFDFLKIGLPGLCIPGLYCFGPELAVGVGFDVELQASAQALVKGTLVWNNMNIFVDLKTPSNSRINGPKPSISGTTTLSGSMTAKAALSLPISIGVGFEVLSWFDVSAQFVVSPGVAIASTYTIDFTASNTDGQSSISGNINGIQPGVPFCAGINWREYGFVATSIEALKLSYPLSEDDFPPFAMGCYGKMVTWNPKPKTTTSLTTTSTTAWSSTRAQSSTAAKSSTTTDSSITSPTTIQSSITAQSSTKTDSSVTSPTTIQSSTTAQSSTKTDSSVTSPTITQSSITAQSSTKTDSSVTSPTTIQSSITTDSSTTTDSPMTTSTTIGSSPSTGACNPALYYTSDDGVAWLISNAVDRAGPNYLGRSIKTSAKACWDSCDIVADCQAAVWVQSGQDQQWCYLQGLGTSENPFPSGLVAFSVKRLNVTPYDPTLYYTSGDGATWLISNTIDRAGPNYLGRSVQKSANACWSSCDMVAGSACQAAVWVQSGQDQQWCYLQGLGTAENPFPSGLVAFSVKRVSVLPCLVSDG